MVSDQQSQSVPPLIPEKPRPPRTKLSFDRRIVLTSFLISLPGIVVAELLLWLGNNSLELKWTLTLLIAVVWLAASTLVATEELTKPTVTISYKEHESLWRTQRAIVSAYEYLSGSEEGKAQKASEHVRKAQQLLVEADREVQLAAASSRK